MSAQPIIGEQPARLRVVGGRDFDNPGEASIIPLVPPATRQTAARPQRRRMGWVVWGLAASLAVGGGAGLGMVTDSGPSAGASITVHTGDNLWQLAQEHTPAGGNTREVVADIIELNQLTTTTLHAGQVLVMPR